MDNSQRVHDRRQNRPGLVPGDFSSLPFQKIDKAHSLDIVHDKISRTVFFEKAVDFYNILVADKFGKRPGFIQKAVHAILKSLAFGMADRNHLVWTVSLCRLFRKIFLDGDRLVSFIVICQISNAEAALAQYFSQHIPAVQNRTALEGIRVILPVEIAGRKTTAGAAVFPAFIFMKAVETCFFHENLFPDQHFENVSACRSDRHMAGAPKSTGHAKRLVIYSYMRLWASVRKHV